MTLISFKRELKPVTGEDNGSPLQYSCLEIPWTEEPGSKESDMTEHPCMYSPFSDKDKLQTLKGPFSQGF